MTSTKRNYECTEAESIGSYFKIPFNFLQPLKKTMNELKLNYLRRQIIVQEESFHSYIHEKEPVFFHDYAFAFCHYVTSMNITKGSVGIRI
jgi:hypothetical protein